jgi:hypothetical protein
MGVAVSVGDARGDGLGRTSPAGVQAASTVMAHSSRRNFRIGIIFIIFDLKQLDFTRY